MISGMKKSPVAPLKWWNLRPSSSATSRNRGRAEGTPLVAFQGQIARPASPKEKKPKKSRRPSVPLFLALTVDFRALQDAAGRARCSRGVRLALALRHYRVLDAYTAGHSGGRQNVRVRRRARKRIAGCPGLSARAVLSIPEFPRYISAGSPIPGPN